MGNETFAHFWYFHCLLLYFEIILTATSDAVFK